MDLGRGNWRSFLRQLLNYHTWLQPAAAMMIIMMGLQWPINLGRKIYVMLAVGADIVPSAWIIISGGASERMQKFPLCGSYFVGFKIQSANIVQHKTSNINRTPEPSGSYNPPKGKQSSPVSKLQKKKRKINICSRHLVGPSQPANKLQLCCWATVTTFSNKVASPVG